MTNIGTRTLCWSGSEEQKIDYTDALHNVELIPERFIERIVARTNRT